MRPKTYIALKPQNNPAPVAKEVAPTHHPLDFEPDSELNDRFPIQLKLSVGAANDPLEHEADAMADKVMRMPDTPFGQRQTSNAAHHQDEGHVRLKPLVNQVTPFIQAKGDGGSVVSDSVSNKIKSSMGGGNTMDGGTRSFMEDRFGTGFGDVKIHNNADSEQLNRSLNAKAFTVGNNIWFNSGQYQPESSSGKHLLAHELTHVVQQGGGHSNSPIQAKKETIQRFESEEHQELGDLATGKATYNLGKDGDKFELTHGDVLALSGDVFMPDELFELASIKGENGTKIGTRDEVIWGLQDPRIWEMRAKKDKRLPFAQQKDPRFEPGGIYGGYKFTEALKNKVFERYQKLGAANAGHFVSPLGRDASGKPIPADNSAGGNYLKYHKEAIRKADHAGRAGAKIDMAMAYDAAAQHYLTDAFSAGHLRTPVGLIREYWGKKYPLFWYNLLHKIALDTAIQMTSWTPFTAHFGYVRILKQVMDMAPTLPPVTLGDLLSSVFHDYDNEKGLKIKGGGRVMGDSHLDPATRTLAIAAIKASNNDVSKAYEIGKQNPNPFITDDDLFAAVRAATIGSGDKFAPETQMPEPDSSEPPQNWKASDINQLWGQPFLGTEKETTGDVISRMIRGDGSISVQLKALALKFPEWAVILRPRHSYLVGFVEKMQNNPKDGVLDIINWAPHGMDTGYAFRDTAADLEGRGDAGDQKENLRNMTYPARIKFIKGLMSDGKTADQEMIVHIFNSTPLAGRSWLYQEIEGHTWANDFGKKDKLYKAMHDKNILIRLKYSINGI